MFTNDTAEMPRTSSILSAMGFVMGLLPFISSFRCDFCIPIMTAKSFWEISLSSNSYLRMVPGWVAVQGVLLSFLVAIVVII